MSIIKRNIKDKIVVVSLEAVTTHQYSFLASLETQPLKSNQTFQNPIGDSNVGTKMC